LNGLCSIAEMTNTKDIHQLSHNTVQRLVRLADLWLLTNLGTFPARRFRDQTSLCLVATSSEGFTLLLQNRLSKLL